MCQLQLIKKLNGNLNDRDITEFFKLMTFGSFDNKDAFGLFNDKLVFKNSGKFNLKGCDYKKIFESSFVVGHNRLKTTGDEENNNNNHPFILNDFILAHNGIISNNTELRIRYNIPDTIETDSYTILFLIDYFFNKSDLKKREDKILFGIKKTAKLLSGSFSVFFYDKLVNNLYYFKNKETYFAFCLLDDSIIMGTTNSENFDFVYLNHKYIFDEHEFKSRLVREPKDNVIYLINDDVKIKEIGKFKPKKEKTISYINYCGGINEDYSSYDKDSLKNDEFSNMDREDIILQIDDCLKLMLSYLPNYRFIRDEFLIGIDYDKKLYKKIKEYLPEIYIKNDVVYIPIDDLFYIFKI